MVVRLLAVAVGSWLLAACDLLLRLPAGALLTSNNSQNLGVTTHIECRRLGVNVSATEAFWLHNNAGSMLQAAVCFHD